jgi:hypothetical protein
MAKVAWAGIFVARERQMTDRGPRSVWRDDLKLEPMQFQWLATTA